MSASGYSSSEDESDDQFSGESIYHLPSVTSQWTGHNLESLGIFYHQTFSFSPLHILDKVFNATGSFAPLTETERKYINFVMNKLSFNASVQDIIVGSKINAILEPLMLQMKNDIENLTTCAGSEQQEHLRLFGLVQEFIIATQLMISYQAAYLMDDYGHRRSQGSVPEDIFVDIFKKFTSICHLISVPGSAFVAKKILHHKKKVNVSSESDIVLLPKCYKDDMLENTLAEELPVVAVVEVKNLSHIIHQTGGSRNEDFDKPDIYQTVCAESLGQHGGQLLLHKEFYIRKLRSQNFTNYLLGMIVVGTQVTFTLLEITYDHVKEIGSKDKHSSGRRSEIYYSEPMDFLKKEDRNILLESLLRLNNI